MQTVAIIDYGSGNLHSAAKSFERAATDCGRETRVIVTARTADVRAADRIVLPGVGAYADCRRGLDAVPGMVGTLEDVVHNQGRPFLGICVGMQLMAQRGLEHGTTEGLGWIEGDVAQIDTHGTGVKIPHMGWNTLNVRRTHALLDGIPTGPDGLHAYFVHSYHLIAQDAAQLIAETEHGGPVTAMVGRDNMIGVQFHPEKSQTLGLSLIANFLRWSP